MKKEIGRFYFLSVYIFLGVLFIAGPLSAASVIDITDSLPPTFPSDNSAFLLGDHSNQPYFFWIQDNVLYSYQVGADGVFKPYSFPVASSLPSSLSRLKMAVRSYWASTLVFCGLQDSSLSFWAISDRPKGFELANLQTVTVPKGASLPSFWVLPYGRFGWLILWQDSDGLKGLLTGFDGTTKSLGVVAGGVFGIESVKLVERPDLDSKQADLIVLSQTNGRNVFQAIHLDKSQIGNPVTLWQTDLGTTLPEFEAFSLDSEKQYLFTTVSGSVCTSLVVTDRQVGQPLGKDFMVPLSLSQKSGIGSPSAVVLSEKSGTRFWWEAVGPEFSMDNFRQGLLPGVDAPAPLLVGPNGSWMYLTSIISGGASGLTTLAFTKTFIDSPDTTSTQSVATQSLIWELGQDPSESFLITVSSSINLSFLPYSPSDMSWGNPLNSSLAGGDLALHEILLAKIGIPLNSGAWRVWSYNELDYLFGAPWVTQGPAWGLAGLAVVDKQAK